jgi:hypothetical protein
MQSVLQLSHMDLKLSKVLQNIEGWLFESEAKCLYDYAQKAINQSVKSSSLVEIGSYMGRSTRVIALACKNNKKCKVLSIDPHFKSKKIDTKKTLIKNLNRLKLAPYVDIHVTTSDKAAQDYSSLHINFLFVDGDHRYQQVKKDVENWGAKLKPNGYLLLHDTINIDGPRRVVLKMLLSPRYIYIGNVTEVAIFQKVLFVTPRQWIKKIIMYMSFMFFLKFYTPDIS